MATYNDSYSLPRNPIPSSPISIVDIFFPGFTNISAAFQQLQASNTNDHTQMLCILGIVVFFGRYAYNFVKRLVDTYFTSTIHISDTDEAYDMLRAWLSSQPFADDVSSSLASVGARERRFARGRSDKSLKKTLQYSPWNGTFTFWYKKRLVTFRSMQREDPFHSSNEDVSISCVGRSSKILKDLLNECREKYLASVENRTTIFTHRNGGWDKKNAVAIRQSNSVIIDEEEKTALLEDTKGFLESQQWYSAKGIPHRKGYLFYGPPGTGKSSLSLLIAGACDLDIYILKLSRLDDDSLDKLFGALPERCLVLLEDIDAVDAAHSRLATPRQDGTGSSVKENYSKVSLSALLNAIDGIDSQEGRLLIMTTNHVDRLDEALIRPGRVDVKLELGLATHDTNAQLFFNTFESGMPNDKDKAEEDKRLRKIAEEFANKVPDKEFSPAEIRLFLVANRNSPGMAVQNLQEWIVKVREEKRKTTAPAPQGKSSSSSVDSTSPHEHHLSSATPQDCAPARDMPIAALDTSRTVAESHCCSCQVIEDIRGICMRERIPSVQLPYPVQEVRAIIANNMQIEKSLLLTYLSDLKTCRGVSAVRDHSTDKFLSLLLDFVKKYYASTAERCVVQPAAPLTYPNLRPISASRGILPLIQPERKTVAEFENLLAPTAKKHYAISELEKFWDEDGWEPIAFGPNHATPGISHDLQPPAYLSSEAASNERSDDDASSGTSFESGSQSDIEEPIRQTEVVEESAELGIKRKLHRQPATPPPSPVPSTAGLLAGGQAKRYGAFYSGMETALKNDSAEAR